MALSRESIRPGTLYADPYGHLMIVIKWIPQTTEDYGILLAADAQPDGTIGRRRFWRGTFLFSPDTSKVGAGFKHFRPVRVASKTEAIQLTNSSLQETDSFPRYSTEQYKGSVDDFYDRMATLINPRPLDPFAMQSSLVDAFAEAVSRRVVSVDNAIQYKKKKPGVIDMPSGYDIFETSGAWEDYSSPSRDMRLLIALDTVVKFRERVRKKPEAYGFTPETVEEGIQRLTEHMNKALTAQSITYVRSNGSEQPLTLKQIVDRAKAFEMAYNPNDCVEVRWGAPRTPKSSPAASAAHRPTNTTRCAATATGLSPGPDPPDERPAEPSRRIVP